MHKDQKEKISKEMYLKTIYLLREEKEEDPRPVDVAKELEVSKPSVSEMLKKLDDAGLVKYSSYQRVSLTDSGIQEAKKVLRRYFVCKEFLSDMIKLDPSKVHDEACKLEHVFSDESITRLDVLLKIWKKSHS